MNRYELAHHEVVTILQERGAIVGIQRSHRLADEIVQRLIETGMIQSTEPGDLVPGGLEDGVHKATPPNGTGKISEAVCRHCGLQIRPVPGGQGMTWVHALTGTVAGTGGPR
jgi:hypothetical protein